MHQLRFVFLSAVVAATLLFASCGSGTGTYPVRTYSMGEKVTLGHIDYEVFETQWLTHIGSGADARVPQSRFFLVRMQATNSSSGEIIVPNFVLEDDNGGTYPELSSGEGVPQYIGYLRTVKPTDWVRGNAVFDAPPRHYKMKITDETGERTAYIDIPLSFVSETPDIPELGGKDKKK
jgi:hypothetical protein